ncbi:MAG: FKBP-type peptidyl-prolyl cis-trans isomerase [Ilumatobacteraceae bacterium]
MRRTLSITMLLIAVAGCGGVDETTATVAPTIAPSTVTTPSTVPVGTLECETDPDQADYVEGQIPPANRPCEIPTELQIHAIRSGTGRAAEDGDTLILDYTGIRAADGRLFDTSYTRGEPLDFVLGRGSVIQGWDDGLEGAQADSLVKLDIPPALAYGDTPPAGSDIEPGAALTFIIEIRAVVPAVTAEDAPLDLDLQPSVGATEASTQVLTEGDGATVAAGDTALVQMLLVRGDNEVVLFNTWERSEGALRIKVEDGQTLPGILEALDGARVGSTLAVTMPPADAFGEDGQTSLGLPAGVDLIAIVQIVGAY